MFDEPICRPKSLDEQCPGFSFGPRGAQVETGGYHIEEEDTEMDSECNALVLPVQAIVVCYGIRCVGGRG